MAFLESLRNLPRKARKRIAGGQYERRDFLDAILTRDVVLRLLHDALTSAAGATKGTSYETICAEIEARIYRIKELAKRSDTIHLGGKYGHAYCDLLAELIPACLGPAVNHRKVRRESPATGGWIDFTIPLRLAVLDAYPLWKAWRDDYQIRKVLVESKNQRRPVGPNAVGQVLRYQETSPWGKCAFLVSRSGFTDGAKDILRKFAREHERLVLPFAQDDLYHLASSSIAGRTACMDFLNDKQLELA